MHITFSLFSIFIATIVSSSSSSSSSSSTNSSLLSCNFSTNCTEIAITQDTLSSLLPNSSSKTRSVQILDSCEFLDPFGYSDIIQAKLNELRASNITTTEITTNSTTISHTNTTTTYGQVPVSSSSQTQTQNTKKNLSKICQNIKLSKAAQLQSTYQAILNMPTHSGPRMLIPQGNVVERVLYQGYNLDSNSSIKEFIYHFPNLPSNTSAENPPPFKEAFDSWIKDPEILKELLKPEFEFMGIGFGKGSRHNSNNQSSTLYLTIILATQTPYENESCSICPMKHDFGDSFNNSTLIYLQSGQILSSSDLKPISNTTTDSEWNLD